MTTAPAARPDVRPKNPQFSPGPTTKFPGWTPEALAGAPVGRSHRSRPGKAKIVEVIERSRALLGLPEGWRLGVMAGSDTGAVEAAMWNLIGPRGVDVLVWENFGNDWAVDAVDQLPHEDVRVIKAAYGFLPDLGKVDWDRDVVLTWNGTTSGVRMPSGDMIPADRAGLVIADATSAVFAMDIPYDKVDVLTWSWQKVLGGEAQHGMLALSPRAVARIESHRPAWPIPKIYRLRKGDGLNEGLFEGATLNTVSLLACEDHVLGLKWAGEIGGLAALHARAQANFDAFSAWIEGADWADWLAVEPETRSVTSLCFRITDPAVTGLPDEAARHAFVKKMTGLLDAEGVAYDIGGYRTAPASLRIWGGGTVEASDIAALGPWLDWAFATVKAEYASA